MDLEIILVVVAVFVSGGAVGTAGTLLAQWLLRSVRGAPGEPRRAIGNGEMDVVRADLADLDRKLRNIDARLNFQEQLLGGATPAEAPPPRLENGGEDEE